MEDVVVQRLETCLRLANDYQEQMNALQQRVGASGEPEMEFSQALAFGKLRATSQRFQDIITIVQVVKRHTLLLQSHAEGRVQNMKLS